MGFSLFIAFALLQGAILARIFIWLVERGQAAFAALLVAFSAIWSAYVTLYLIYGAGFFGRALVCLTIPASALALLVFVRMRRRFLVTAGALYDRRRIIAAGLLAIPLLQIAPLPGMFATRGICAALNRRTGDIVAEAVGDYWAARGAYPADIAELVPEFAASLPTARCFGPYTWFGAANAAAATFELVECRNPARTLLTVPDVTTDFILRLDLQTGRWATVSFLDGVCSYLD